MVQVMMKIKEMCERVNAFYREKLQYLKENIFDPEFQRLTKTLILYGV
jgi:hypothetical protein